MVADSYNSFDYRPFCEQIARDAGKIFLKYYREGMGTRVKADKTVVTKADTEINSLVIKRVAEAFPTHQVLGEEESSASKLDADYIWVCDPVDGTFPFSIHVPVSVFSLALTYKGDPIAAVIFEPQSDRLFFAQKGKGTYLNGTQIFVSKKTFADTPAVMIEDSIWAGQGCATFRQYCREAKVFTFGLPSIAAASVLVARGAAEATVFTGTKPWDCAAYALLVTEAGGKVTDLAGKSQRYDRDTNGCIASNGILHDKIVELVQKK